MENAKMLYERFLTDKRTYNLNVSYWRIKLQKALNETLSSKDQFFANKMLNGKSFYDGNPIFSYYKKDANRAVRIIQEDPSELESNVTISLITAWIDSVEYQHNELNKEIPELVISLFLTRSSVDQCMKLVKLWFKGDLNRSNIKEMVG